MIGADSTISKCALRFTMKYTLWITIGLGIILLGLLGRVLYANLIKPIPGAAARFGKAWGTTTDRYAALRALNTLFYIIGVTVTLLGLVAGASAVLRPKPATAPVIVQPVVDEKLEANQILQLVNNERQRLRLPKLASDPRLVAVAEARAKDMTDNQYYAHINQDGKYFDDLFPSFNFKADYSCENLDIEFTTTESVYVNDWLESTKGHRECMLHKDTSTAGYAATVFGETQNGKIYLVVGIHATELKPTSAPVQPR